MHSFPHSANYNHFVAELRAVREEAGLSQAQLAEHLGVDRTLVTKAEGGGRRLDVVELGAWMTAIGIDLASFVTRLEARWARNAQLTPRARPVRKVSSKK
jgi:transcriptional regulator with XRE-family HTH domain